MHCVAYRLVGRLALSALHGATLGCRGSPEWSGPPRTRVWKLPGSVRAGLLGWCYSSAVHIGLHIRVRMCTCSPPQTPYFGVAAPLWQHVTEAARDDTRRIIIGGVCIRLHRRSSPFCTHRAAAHIRNRALHCVVERGGAGGQHGMAARSHTARALAHATRVHRRAASLPPRPRLGALTVHAQAHGVHHAAAGPCRRCAVTHSLPRDARAEHHAQCVAHTPPLDRTAPSGVLS